MTERIKQIMEKEGLNPSSFADQIGISKGTMNHILNGRNNPSLDVVTKILESYPKINSDWMLFGKLPVYKSEKTYVMPDLFGEESIIQAEEPKKIEYRKEIEVKKSVEEPEKIKTEVVTIEKIVSKKIIKIMIFYSDNTFDSFNPENI